MEFLAAENAFGTAEFEHTVADNGTLTSAGGGNETPFRRPSLWTFLALTTRQYCQRKRPLAAASEDQDYTIQASDLLAGVTDPDIVNNTNI